MNILHIGTEICGGAGLGMYRLHKDLLNRGVESRVLCLRHDEDADSTVFGYLGDGRTKGQYRRSVLAAALNKFHIYASPYYRSANIVSQMRNSGMVSSPYTRFHLDRLELVRNADVIHLHWVANFIDYPSFFKNVRKPIVWTLRDENPALGYWHFRQDKPQQLPNGIAEADESLRILKAQWIRGVKTLATVSLSSDEDLFFAQSHAFKGRRHCVIPNSIDGNIFYRHGREKIREEYGIPDDAPVLIFVAQWLSEQRKGLADLLAALKILNRKELVLICVGGGELPALSIRNRIIVAGRVTDTNRLSSLFSAADMFVSPSYAETFGKTLTESLACGLPVVSYPNSGAKDIVTNTDGVLCQEFSVEALVAALKEALYNKYDHIDLRNRVLTRFSPEKVAQCYINLYESIMNK